MRDKTLAEGDKQATIIPKSDVNREYTASMQERAIENGDIDKIYESEAGKDPGCRNLLVVRFSISNVLLYVYFVFFSASRCRK